jgi:Mg-chelatase subunit ChlD
MRHTLKALACAATLFLGSIAFAADTAAPTTQPRKSVEVCFVLDTTGSMGGLIDGAKKKIWTIANGIVAADKKAQVKFALVPYRDRGDEYVTKIFDLTDDLDMVFADLQSFTANGGGDGPESVNQALDDAVNKVAWSSGDSASKIIFLVGDAPPHMDYQDDVKYPQTCESAVRKNLIINTVQCGQDSSTKPLWQDIARKSEGSYVALEQSGGMVVVETPVDKELAEVSAQLGALAVPYGSREQQRGVSLKNASAAAAPAAVAAERALFNAASATTSPTGVVTGGKVIQGRGDLVADLADNAVALESLKEDELPENMRKMTAGERQTYLKQQAESRGKLTARVNDLAKQRQAFIDAENKKLAESGKGDAFDAKVTEIVNGQVNRKK